MEASKNFNMSLISVHHYSICSGATIQKTQLKEKDKLDAN